MSEVKSNPTRRERIFSVTKLELAQAARELVVEGGQQAVTVREVAARVGMTAPAIYRYFASREALLEQVIVDLYGELAAHLVEQRDAKKSANAAERLRAVSRGFRRWALDHRGEFGLLFGAPIPGVVVDKDHQSEDRGADFGRVWFEMFVEIDAMGTGRTWDRPISSAARSAIAAFTERLGAPIDARSAMMYLYCWQSIYGAVCTEAFGHMNWAFEDGEDLFEGVLERRLYDLGLS